MNQTEGAKTQDQREAKTLIVQPLLQVAVIRHMNAKIEKKSASSKTSSADVVKYLIAALLLAGGVVGFYWLTAWPTPLRSLLVVIGFVAALAVFALTAAGRHGLEFLAESRFELRKVVWPTRQESLQTTGVIIVVIAVISLILAAIDLVLGFGVGKLLS